MDIIGLISFSVFLVILVALSYTAIAFGLKNRKLVVEIVQLNIDKAILISKLDKALNAKDAQSLEKTDGFVKFLSESRDWAFQYIEKVQQAIDAVKVSASYGQVSEESLLELFNLLPENKQGETNE